MNLSRLKQYLIYFLLLSNFELIIEFSLKKSNLHLNEILNCNTALQQKPKDWELNCLDQVRLGKISAVVRFVFFMNIKSSYYLLVMIRVVM